MHTTQQHSSEALVGGESTPSIPLWLACAVQHRHLTCSSAARAQWCVTQGGRGARRSHVRREQLHSPQHMGALWPSAHVHPISGWAAHLHRQVGLDTCVMCM